MTSPQPPTIPSRTAARPTYLLQHTVVLEHFRERRGSFGRDFVVIQEETFASSDGQLFGPRDGLGFGVQNGGDFFGNVIFHVLESELRAQSDATE